MEMSGRLQRGSFLVLSLLLIMSLILPVFSEARVFSAANEISYVKKGSSVGKVSLAASKTIKLTPLFPNYVFLLCILAPLLIVMFRTYYLLYASIPHMLRRVLLTPIKYTSIYVSHMLPR